MIEMEEFMNFLMRRSVAGLPPSALAEVFDRLVWCMDDNGRNIEEVRRKWLVSSNKFKVEVALNMSATFPFESKKELDACMSQIKQKWPELSELCAGLLESWDREYLNDSQRD